jgi:hypothetical protein
LIKHPHHQWDVIIQAKNFFVFFKDIGDFSIFQWLQVGSHFGLFGFRPQSGRNTASRLKSHHFREKSEKVEKESLKNKREKFENSK